MTMECTFLKLLRLFLLLPYSISASNYVSLFPANITSLHNTGKVSDECLNQLLNIDIKTHQLMLDFSTKIPTGFTTQNFKDYGSFDECYNIESTVNNETMYGKFCLGTVSMILPKSEINSNHQDFSDITSLVRIKVRQSSTNGLEVVEYYWSICLPNKCTPEEVSVVPNFKEKYCYSKDSAPKLTTGAIITIAVLSFFLLITACSTILDIYSQYIGNTSSQELLTIFSVLTNGKKLFLTSAARDQLPCLNGLKVLSMMCVILGHTYSCAHYAGEPHIYLLYAHLAVDVFLTITGLITIYTFLQATDKGAKFNIVLYYLHRYLRITPALVICILIYANLLRYLGNGPIWGKMEEVLSDDCINYWWSSLFYLTNFTRKMCMAQTWYLSVDIQLFILSPLILIPLWKSEKFGVFLLGILCVLGIIVPFSIGYVYKLHAAIYSDYAIDYVFIYYMQTHTRFGPYVIGMLFGYFLHKIKKDARKVLLKPIHVYGLWLISIAGLIACVYVPYETLQTYDRLGHSLILGFQRPAWSLSICIIIYLCVCGFGGPINQFLSLPIFELLTKLSYSMYLVHYAVVHFQLYRTRTPVHLSNTDAMFMFCGNFMVSAILSIILYLGFEAPIIALQKFIFGRANAVKQSNKAE